MQIIDKMIDDILRREGGFVDHPADRGGPTKYGITQKTLAAYTGRSVLRQDVEMLSEALAREIYERNYFFDPGIDRLPAAIRAFIFDCSVNHGPGQALRFVQGVCNQAGYSPELAEDGLMGANTQAAAEWAQDNLGDGFLRALIDRRRDFYSAIVAARPSQKVFLRGWMNRIDEFDTRVT